MSADDGTATSVDVPEQRASGKTKKHLPLWQETLLLLTIAIVLAVVIKAFFVQAFYIPSESMEPGLVKNDRILVQKVSYWGGGSPQRGDVVGKVAALLWPSSRFHVVHRPPGFADIPAP